MRYLLPIVVLTFSLTSHAMLPPEFEEMLAKTCGEKIRMMSLVTTEELNQHLDLRVYGPIGKLVTDFRQRFGSVIQDYAEKEFPERFLFPIVHEVESNLRMFLTPTLTPEQLKAHLERGKQEMASLRQLEKDHPNGLYLEHLQLQFQNPHLVDLYEWFQKLHLQIRLLNLRQKFELFGRDNMQELIDFYPEATQFNLPVAREALQKFLTGIILNDVFYFGNPRIPGIYVSKFTNIPSLYPTLTLSVALAVEDAYWNEAIILEYYVSHLRLGIHAGPAAAARYGEIAKRKLKKYERSTRYPEKRAAVIRRGEQLNFNAVDWVVFLDLQKMVHLLDAHLMMAAAAREQGHPIEYLGGARILRYLYDKYIGPGKDIEADCDSIFRGTDFLSLIRILNANRTELPGQ